MRSCSRLTCIAAILFTTSLTTAQVESAQVAETIYVGGDIVTVDDKNPTAEALAVQSGKIIAVGTKADVLKLKGDVTKVIDLGGKALLPAFIDAHSHYINSLLVANQCKLYAPPSGPGKDVPSIIAELKKFVADQKIPKGKEIIGYGYDENVMPDGRMLNRDVLDEAFPDHPVRIDHVSMHGSGVQQPGSQKIWIQRRNEDTTRRRDRPQARHE